MISNRLRFENEVNELKEANRDFLKSCDSLSNMMDKNNFSCG
jgi:hypothetical protein